MTSSFSGELGALEQEVHLSPSHCISSLTLTRPPPSPSFQGPPDRPYPKDTCGPGVCPGLSSRSASLGRLIHPHDFNRLWLMPPKSTPQSRPPGLQVPTGSHGVTRSPVQLHGAQPRLPPPPSNVLPFRFSDSGWRQQHRHPANPHGNPRGGTRRGQGHGSSSVTVLGLSPHRPRGSGHETPFLGLFFSSV